MKYFFGTVGLNADIKRHREEELRLQAKIDELEAVEDPNEMQKRSLNTYRYFMHLLQVSKANVVNKLGRK